MEVKVKETRGQKAKYNFSDMTIGLPRLFAGPNTMSLLGCAKRYSEKHGLGWEFRCYREDKDTIAVVRIK